LPEAIVPKVGHGPKMGQYGFDRVCFSVFFLLILCFIAHLYEANGGTDMEVLACFRPGFLNKHMIASVGESSRGFHTQGSTSLDGVHGRNILL